ncbi:hypothetical protein AB685_29335 [Bacillus sp. LL01]|uniref:diaminopimelate decarboxylase family protein n=1 Tax=Bacillus sp. LL01 TaxID=1665556 RepID=UPI00064D34D1|nr:hypothetical protein [Bacillus sp. LL01]KMJ55043.1 hypothetical protein AB685_29335 [Bacillus sp. LL01]
MDMSTKEYLEPLYSQPEASLFDLITEVKTPALVYDLKGMKDVVRRIQEDLSLVQNTKLNLAVKATHTPEILAQYARWGLGCDVASIGEYKLAKEAGFSEITTTAPAYTVQEMNELMEGNCLIDLDSISQLTLYGESFPHTEIGLRIRMPLPSHLESNATFGNDSRFGINSTDPLLDEVIEKYALTVKRIHVHSGQMTPESLLYKADYLLALAERFKKVDTIDFGGGLFHFYVDRAEARNYLRRLNNIVEEWTNKHRREMHFRFEPGGALLAGCGYLVATVLANEYHDHFKKRILTLNLSAWNLAPWHKPQVFALQTASEEVEPYFIAGNTLYEGDFFGKDTNGSMMEFHLATNLELGTPLLFTASGAYTMTNSRQFNRIPLPQEYVYENDSLSKIVRGHGCEK